MSQRIMIDGREFVAGRRTGIGRFLEGLLLALRERHPDWKLTVAMHKQNVLPVSLDGKVSELYLPHLPELFWPILTKGQDLFLSPYPKLPWRKLPCPSIHTVHDVFYLTHPAYQGNVLRRIAASWRLKSSLKRASLTWFDSQESQQECEDLFGHVKHASVRYPAVEKRFTADQNIEKEDFFLYVGNGLPHKNVDILLQAIEGTMLQLKCVGISHGVANKQVEYLQGVDDMDLLQLYRQSRALLLPSTAEGYGYPPLEAMCCGTPAIVSDIAVLRETTGNQAIYCSPDDAKAWRSAMLSVLKDGVDENQAKQALIWAVEHQGMAGWAAHLDDIDALVQDRSFIRNKGV